MEEEIYIQSIPDTILPSEDEACHSASSSSGTHSPTTTDDTAAVLREHKFDERSFDAYYKRRSQKFDSVRISTDKMAGNTHFKTLINEMVRDGRDNVWIYLMVGM